MGDVESADLALIGHRRSWNLRFFSSSYRTDGSTEACPNLNLGELLYLYFLSFVLIIAPSHCGPHVAHLLQIFSKILCHVLDSRIP